MDMFREWKREDYHKKLWNGVHQEEENEEYLNLPGRKGLEDCLGGGGEEINRRRLEWQRQMEEKDRIIVKWAQGHVEMSNNLLNNNNSNNNNFHSF